MVVGESDEKKPQEETQSTSTYTYALAINKVKEDATGLADAKFMITKGNDTILVQATEEEGVYNYVGIATTEQVTAKISRKRFDCCKRYQCWQVYNY